MIGWSLFSISSVKKPRTGPIQEGGEMPTQPNLILNQGIFRSLLVCGDLKTFCPMIWTSTDLCRWVRVIKEARSRGRGRGPIFKNPASTDTPSESQPPPEPSKHESPPNSPLPMSCNTADRNSTAFQEAGRQVHRQVCHPLGCSKLCSCGWHQRVLVPPITSIKWLGAQALLSDHTPLALTSSGSAA